jgi:hypothetical protein
MFLPEYFFQRSVAVANKTEQPPYWEIFATIVHIKSMEKQSKGDGPLTASEINRIFGDINCGFPATEEK